MRCQPEKLTRDADFAGFARVSSVESFFDGVRRRSYAAVDVVLMPRRGGFADSKCDGGGAEIRSSLGERGLGDENAIAFAGQLPKFLDAPRKTSSRCRD
jgi:hypothetical protein